MLLRTRRSYVRIVPGAPYLIKKASLVEAFLLDLVYPVMRFERTTHHMDTFEQGDFVARNGRRPARRASALARVIVPGAPSSYKTIGYMIYFVDI